MEVSLSVSLSLSLWEDSVQIPIKKSMAQMFDLGIYIQSQIVELPN